MRIARTCSALLCLSIAASLPAQNTPNAAPVGDGELLLLKNETVKLGLDRTRGASIAWLSWKGHPGNAVNIADPGRLIQQSYYAGLPLDRTSEGQSRSWSPWTWNPIQGGGVGSWARVTELKRLDDSTLFGETVPKLWDMPDEEAAAVMRQWTAFEPGTSNVVVVRCELLAKRNPNDRWGPASVRPQEVPACYFTRNFDSLKSYLGDGKWREESQPPGPPWGTTHPPLKVMAAFEKGGQGIAVFSPTATEHWNFGPHGGGLSDDPKAGPCIHIAPVSRVMMGPTSTYSYRYWLAMGDAAQLAASLDVLLRKHADEQARLTNVATTTAE